MTVLPDLPPYQTKVSEKDFFPLGMDIAVTSWFSVQGEKEGGYCNGAEEREEEMSHFL